MGATTANSDTRFDLGRHCHPAASEAAVASAPWAVAVVPGLRAAEELLDHLEAHGFRQTELLAVDGSSFAVRWR